MSTSVILEQSKIYGRYKDNAKLSSWQKAVNDAAFVITQEAPDKLYDRSQLKLEAEEKARATYVFKKKSGSRSKFEDTHTATRKKMSTAERKQELASSSCKIQKMTTMIAELEKDINKAKVMKDFELCSKLHGEQRKMIKEQNRVKKKYNYLQKKEQKHQWYQEKRRDDGRSKASSSECEDVLQKDIRHFMQKKSADPSTSNTKIAEEMHGSQSGDTVMVDSSTSEEEKSKSSSDGGWLDMTVPELKRKIHPASKEIIGDTEQLVAGDEGEDKRKKMKIDVVEHQQEGDMECLEHNNSSVQDEEEIFCCTQADPVHTDVEVGSKQLDDENSNFL